MWIFWGAHGSNKNTKTRVRSEKGFFPLNSTHRHPNCISSNFNAEFFHDVYLQHQHRYLLFLFFLFCLLKILLYQIPCLWYFPLWVRWGMNLYYITDIIQFFFSPTFIGKHLFNLHLRSRKQRKDTFDDENLWKMSPPPRSSSE